MNNKQLAEMVKSLCKKKLEEQDPKAETSAYLKKQKFKPEHIPDSSEASPNDYKHRMAEGARIAIGNRLGKGTLGNLRKRASVHIKNGSQSSRYRYLNKNSLEENKKEVELGPTDTGQTGETVTSNPTDNTASATGSMNKNTSTREIKEKKNATMG